LVAVFLLYTNLPVVAAHEGAVPPGLALLTPVLLLLAVVYQLVIRRHGVVVDRSLLLMMVFLGVFLIASFAAEGHDAAASRIATFVGEGLLIYFLVRNAIRSLPELQTAVLAVLFATTLLAGLSVVQAVTGDYDQSFLGLAQRNLERFEEGAPVPMNERDEMGLEDRARGPVNDPNRFAQILLMAMPLGLVVGLNAMRRRGALMAWLQVGLILAGVLLTYSRGGLVTLVIMVFLLAPLRLVRPHRLAIMMIVGLLAAPVVIPGFSGRVASVAGVAGLFGKAGVEADGPTRGRVTEMLAALAAYMDHPVLGVGPGQYLAHHSVYYQALPEISFRQIPVPRRAHSLYLEIAAETGTVGLLIFMAIPLLLLRDLERLRRALYVHDTDLARWAAGFFLVLVAYLGTGVFLHLAFERYYWFMIALAAAATAILERAVLRHTEPVYSPMVQYAPRDRSIPRPVPQRG
jgi:hypothetical protein